MSKWLEKSLQLCLPMVLCAFVLSSAHAQTLQSVAAVNATNYPTLCQDVENSGAGVSTLTANTANCATTSWSDGTGSGSGSGTATTTYGSIRSVGSASEAINAGNTPIQTVTSAAGSFQDRITFPALTTPAFLRTTMTVQGTLTGDPLSYLSSSASLTVDSVTGNSCQVLSLTGSCTVSVAVSPGDYVDFSGTMTTITVTNEAGSSSGTMNYDGKQKKNGASFTLVLVNASGQTVKGVPLVTASGATYPSK